MYGLKTIHNFFFLISKNSNVFKHYFLSTKDVYNLKTKY